mmetsp:Transcript_22093/g.39168  ORF Transcript_22093/g.39168 Transcript_22093/m.39168 type:complete len:80 (+) Transcript_22093:1298-1537(+)
MLARWLSLTTTEFFMGELLSQDTATWWVVTLALMTGKANCVTSEEARLSSWTKSFKKKINASELSFSIRFGEPTYLEKF